MNTHLKKGALRVGQKVYYNSPNRSQDRSRLLTYYEDVRIPAQTYSASAGENIRKVSENLLGHQRSWMEIWANNQQIQEKWTLNAPYQVRYWQGAQAPAPTLASNQDPTPTTPPPTPVAKVAPAQQPEASSQASLNLDQASDDEVFEENLDEDIFDEPIAADEGTEKPDMELEKPAQVENVAAAPEAEGDIFDDPIDEDLDEIAAEEGFDSPQENDPAQANGGQAVAGVDGRDIARNQGGFPAKRADGFLNSELMRKGLVGVSLLLLLIVGYLVVKRRREAQNAIEMESFDFGGETAIDDSQEKTQIDL